MLNKIDLAEAVGFQRDVALANIRTAAPRARILEVSARTGAGLDAWYGFLREHVRPRAARGA